MVEAHASQDAGYDRSRFSRIHGYILSVFAVPCHVTYVMVGKN